MGEIGCAIEELKKRNPRGILISPGPGTPQDSGIPLQTVLELGPIVPLFGVCMGLQCIGEAFGGKIIRASYGVMHGKSSHVFYDEKGEDGLLAGLPNPFTACRYHSLYRHLQAVQFHPDSIITTEGKIIVCNFLKLVEKFGNA
ncbi:hypothetical protein MKX01_012737 [Papaver californicum]|nr:hypothetical protein MKX01_012737 [Papaver californicum]